MNSINIESRIVLGRPETGNDKALITDLPISQVEAIGEWIRANVSPSRTKYCGTSYGMKHGFESDTGIYLTNNQFKDAMLLAGYYPANEYALNWEYFIELKKINNPNPFREWLKLRLDDDDIEIRHFAHDVIYDTEFPIFAEYGLIHRHLAKANASLEVYELFTELWNEYRTRMAAWRCERVSIATLKTRNAKAANSANCGKSLVKNGRHVIHVLSTRARLT